jgi:lysyl-tRNA synthetase, class II
MSNFYFIADLLGCIGEVGANLISTRGRTGSVRVHGNWAFFDLWHDGQRIQCAAASSVHHNLQRYNWIEVTGFIRPTRTGEQTIWVESYETLNVPTNNVEEHLNNCELPEQDLILNPQNLIRVANRSRLFSYTRSYFSQLNYLEVETPILVNSGCGAAARPFETWSNALNQNLTLRVAPEPYLIRMLGAGCSRIFEIAPSFRNEGVSARHNPQFTLLESYCAFSNMHETMDCLERLLVGGCVEINRINTSNWNNQIINWDIIRRISLREIVCEYLNITELEIGFWCAQNNVDTSNGMWRVWVNLFEQYVESNLIQPVFVTEWPVEVSPLAYSNDGVWTNRFELFAGGMEIANGYEQCISANEQAQRFLFQNSQNERGEEMMPADGDYLQAVGYALPPLSGFGLGMDRWLQLLTNTSRISDVRVF